MIKLILLGIIYAVVTAICFIKIKLIGDSIRLEDTIKIVLYLVVFLFTSVLVIQNLWLLYYLIGLATALLIE